MIKPKASRSSARRIGLFTAGLGVAALLAWQAIASGGVPDPLTPHTPAAVASLNIGILVFREGLEAILVLAAIVAGISESNRVWKRSIAVGVAIGVLATLATWAIAVQVIDDLTVNFPALAIQAATGLVAVCVLVVVMNWFFHKVYWTGWIAAHNRRKRSLIATATEFPTSRKVAIGMGLLGFTSLYREGFEVVLFLQSYRLRLGTGPVTSGVSLGIACVVVVAILTFVAHRHLPYRKMLVATGVLLGVVLLVMVGEQAQEMQLAHWLPTTNIGSLESIIPRWMGLWFSVFPTLETIGAQLLAGALVVGSYWLARRRAGHGLHVGTA